jgi:Protein of unknown function, DUF547
VSGICKLVRVALTVMYLTMFGVAAVRAEDADTAFDALLAKYVKPSADGVNRVDYSAWTRSRTDREALDRYIAGQAAAMPSTMKPNESLAYWANTYNAITLKVILDHFPVASIRDIKSEGVWLDPKAYLGPWAAKRIKVEGRDLSLDEIEHQILRPVFKDNRVHYAVNCASFGCPNLQQKAWRAATLESDLDAAARAYVNHPRGVTVTGGKLNVSSIYAWFKVDFGGNDAGVIDHLKKYASADLASKLATASAIDGDSYDWSLNNTVTNAR